MDHRVYGPGGVYGSRGIHGLMVVVHEENWGENGPGEVRRPRGRRIYLGSHNDTFGGSRKQSTSDRFDHPTATARVKILPKQRRKIFKKQTKILSV